MRYDRDEAVRYMGARKDDREAAVLADTAYLKLRNEVQARSVYRVLDCKLMKAAYCLAESILKAPNLPRILKAAPEPCFWQRLLVPKQI